MNMLAVSSVPYSLQRPIPPLQRDKPWERGVLAFFDAGYTWGQLIPTDWFYEAMGIPTERECESIAEHKRASFLFLSQFEKMQDYLLKNHNMHLRNIRGQGYEVVLPDKQTSVAIQDFKSSFQKMARETAAVLQHVERPALSEKQWAENQEAIAKLGFFRRKTRKALL